MASSSVEVKFAQNLAANEKKKREKSLKKLKKFLRLKSSKKDGFKEEDFLKLWKGLHYCMWMQDKPLIQEELSGTLSTLVHDLETLEMKFLFVRTFFITEAREWNSIDRWRIDKFMMLMRNILHELFVVLGKEDWSDDSISCVIDIIKETVLDHSKDSIPDGIRTHVADIYLAELKKVVTNQLEGIELLKLLEPFCNYILKAQNTAIVKRVISRVFEPIINHAVNDLERKTAGEREKAEEEKTGREETEREEAEVEEEEISNESKMIKFDNKLLADHLFQLSNGSDCLTRNRPLVYDIVKRLRDIEEGVLPKKETIVVTPGLSRQDVSEAIQTLTKLQDTDRKQKKKKKRKKKDKENLDANNNEDDTENSDVDTDSQYEFDVQTEKADQPRKRKHSAGTDNIVNSPEPHSKMNKKCTSKTESPKKKVKLDTSAVKCNNTSLNTPKKSFGDKISASDSDTSDKTKESPRKRKHSKSSKSKTESISDSVDEGDMLLKDETTKANNSSAKKRRRSDQSGSAKTGKKEFKTVIEVRKDKKKNVWTESPLLETDHSNNNKRDNKPAASQSDNGASSCQSKTDEIQKNKPENSKSPKNKKKNQNITKSALHNDKKPSEENNVDEDNVKLEKGDSLDGKTNEPKTTEPKAHVTDDLQEGEIEIWVPNKKYKGNKPAGSTFAKFEKTKAPAAFVKKVLTKIKRQSPSVKETKEKGDDSNKTNGSTESASGKKVQFDMKKNKALAFKDSLQISPVVPFHPDKKPEQGILKPSPTVSTGQRSSPGQRKHSVTLERRSLPGALRKSSLTTPVSVLATNKKRKSLSRARASDFFL